MPNDRVDSDIEAPSAVKARHNSQEVDMKEVKLVQVSQPWLQEAKTEAEKVLTRLLNEGWQIETSNGVWQDRSMYVILVREN